MIKNYKLLGLISLLFLVGLITVFLSNNNLTGKKGDIAGLETEKSQKRIVGIVLPHHGLAASLIDKSLKDLSLRERYSKIVIFGPNHFSPEKIPVVSSMELENVSVSRSIIKKLIENFPYLKNDAELIKNEHSITLLLPYIEKYFPTAEVLPLIFSPSYGRTEVDKLSALLKNILPEDTLFIMSVDFSHNVSQLEGIDKNNETIEALKSFDFEKLSKFDDNNLDSPVSAYIWLLMMQKYGAVNWETWQNTHSSVLENDPRLSGTGYVIGIFY